jgi:hypothetical protein
MTIRSRVPPAFSSASSGASSSRSASKGVSPAAACRRERLARLALRLLGQLRVAARLEGGAADGHGSWSLLVFGRSSTTLR